MIRPKAVINRMWLAVTPTASKKHFHIHVQVERTRGGDQIGEVSPELYIFRIKMVPKKGNESD